MISARAVVLVLLAALIAACSLGPAPRAPMAHYDLGGVAERSDHLGARLPFVFVVSEPNGPPWLDGGEMIYRLAYDEPERLRHYANSQWAISPLALVADRLRKALAERSERGAAVPEVGIPADYWVRTTVEEFGQVFESPSASHGVVRLRVVLLKGRAREFVAQSSFIAQVAAATPDARGGVSALGHALDESVNRVVAWIAAVVGPHANAAETAR